MFPDFPSVLHHSRGYYHCIPIASSHRAIHRALALGVKHHMFTLAMPSHNTVATSSSSIAKLFKQIGKHDEGALTEAIIHCQLNHPDTANNLQQLLTVCEGNPSTSKKTATPITNVLKASKLYLFLFDICVTI